MLSRVFLIHIACYFNFNYKSIIHKIPSTRIMQFTETYEGSETPITFLFIELVLRVYIVEIKSQK